MPLPSPGTYFPRSPHAPRARERHSSHVVRSARSLAFESHLGMLAGIEELAKKDERNAVLIADLYDRVKMMTIAAQYQLIQTGQWDTIRCPNCHDPAQWKKEGPVLSWECQNVVCAWQGGAEKVIVE